MSLSVVIPHYFEERTKNIVPIVSSLFSGTYVPDEVVIWNNGAALPALPANVHVISSSRNIGPQGRFLAAMTARGKLILFLDNDVAVRPSTIANLVGWHAALGGVVTLEGREGISGARYSSWPKFYGHGLDKPKKVFHTLGRGELVPRSIVNEAISGFPFGPESQMDDLLFSDALARAGVPVHIVPCSRGTSDLADLPNGGVGMCHESDYQDRRNAVLRNLRGLS